MLPSPLEERERESLLGLLCSLHPQPLLFISFAITLLTLEVKRGLCDGRNKAAYIRDTYKMMQNANPLQGFNGEENNSGALMMLGQGLELDRREDLLQSKTGKPDCYVAIDIGGLSNNIESSPSARVPLQKTLSRKGSQRGGGATERKAAEGDTTATNFTATGGGVGTCERSPLYVHVAGEHKAMMLPRVSTPTGAGEGGARGRKLGKRPSPWRDPRRVLLLFATLSSMGTLVLLYFTLSMGKMAIADVDAR